MKRKTETQFQISNLKFEMAMSTSPVSQNYSTRAIELRRGKWAALRLFLRWRAEQAPPLRPKAQSARGCAVPGMTPRMQAQEASFFNFIEI